MRKPNQTGFTMIEMLMVILLVAILAAVAIPQFLDFRLEAKNAAVNASLGAMRTAIANQKGQMILRCDKTADSWPALASLTANDVVTGGDCTAVQVVSAADRKVVSSPLLPVNAWGPNGGTNTVVACAGAGTGCNQTDATDCAGAAYTAASDGWCYDPATGQIWANSANTTGATPEYTY
jgi:prepilin-type N-terminal cleavage/methylation domain-containing protein